MILATDLQMLRNLANDRKTILKLGVLFYQTFSEFLESIIKTMIFFKVFRDVILSIMDIFPKFKRSTIIRKSAQICPMYHFNGKVPMFFFLILIFFFVFLDPKTHFKHFFFNFLKHLYHAPWEHD